MGFRSVLAASVILTCCASPARAASPVHVAGDAQIPNPRQPQAAVDEQGTIFVTFGAGESIYCATSTDGGKSYGSPVKIAEVPKLALGRRRGPRIAAGQGTVVVTAISHGTGNLLSWRSTDGGKSWQGPLQVNDAPQNAREGLHAMAMGPDGELFCTWLDLRSKKTEIYGARSTDGGQSWSKNRKVYTSPSGSVCECCHPSVTFGSDGTLYVMWRNSLEGARDMYVSTSEDGGETFAAAEKLGTGTWHLNACPMDGGSLAATGPGELTTVWRRDRHIYRSQGEQSEQQLGIGEQPWATAAGSGVWLAWVSQRGGDLWFLGPQLRKPAKLAEHASDPVLAAPIRGDGPVVILWESASGEHSTISSATKGSGLFK